MYIYIYTYVYINIHIHAFTCINIVTISHLAGAASRSVNAPSGGGVMRRTRPSMIKYITSGTSPARKMTEPAGKKRDCSLT